MGCSVNVYKVCSCDDVYFRRLTRISVLQKFKMTPERTHRLTTHTYTFRISPHRITRDTPTLKHTALLHLKGARLLPATVQIWPSIFFNLKNQMKAPILTPIRNLQSCLIDHHINISFVFTEFLPLSCRLQERVFLLCLDRHNQGILLTGYI